MQHGRLNVNKMWPPARVRTSTNGISLTHLLGFHPAGMFSVSERLLAANLLLQLVAPSPLARRSDDRVGGDSGTRPCYRSCSPLLSPIGHPPGLRYVERDRPLRAAQLVVGACEHVPAYKSKAMDGGRLGVGEAGGARGARSEPVLDRPEPKSSWLPCCLAFHLSCSWVRPGLDAVVNGDYGGC